MTALPPCLRIADVAARWQCSPATVRNRIASGDLPALRLGDMLRIPREAVEAYEARCLTQTPHASAASPGGQPGTSDTEAVAFLQDARIARQLSPPPARKGRGA